MADRPRRSTRQASKQQSSTARAASAEPATKAKPRRNVKAPNADPELQLKSLLQSSKSILTTIDVSDIFNTGAWEMLSEESRGELKKLLPPTAFSGYKPSLGKDHPSVQAALSVDSDAMDVDESADAHLPGRSEVDASSLFSDPHFLAAARTFQDHIYSNWFSDSHQEKVSRFRRELRDGTLAVAWKDERWLEENPTLDGLQEQEQESNPLGRTASWNLALAGGATQIKLATLVERGIIRIGDILAYRRNFTNFNLTVEKDVIVQSIDPRTHALTVLAIAGTTRALPRDLVVKEPGADPSTEEDQNASTSIRSMSVINPSVLESALLDLDGRMNKSQRPNGNSWKTFSVWRWRNEAGGPDPTNANERGGRESHGTLFYLRGNFYHEEY